MAALNRNRIRQNGSTSIFVFFLMLLTVAKGLDDVKQTRLSSSQQQTGKSNINIQISESLKDTITIDAKAASTDNTNAGAPPKEFIQTTELLTNSSYAEEVSQTKTKKRLKDHEMEQAMKKQQAENIESGRVENYIYTIQPTKTVSGQEIKIDQTEIKDTSGEAKGVSMEKSGPLKTSWTSFSRRKRGFGTPEDGQNVGGKFGKDEGEKRSGEKSNTGKNYNKIEQTLRKIAKVTTNDGKQHEEKPEVPPLSFRESREEENRKASPDIQDIITGIVNILNGKTSKANEGHTGRPPRPTSTRINNRGPPRISDVPPLDFDGPPSYRPLPPPPPKRVPPPYPFDLPPSMPNIPLPPQPHKPGLSKLPSHPFIDGVPIPERVIPQDHLKKPPRPPTEYDTISMSEPGPNLHSIAVNVTRKPEPPVVKQEPPVVKNNTKQATLNVTVSHQTTNRTSKPDYNIKVTGQKTQQNGGYPNKNGNKRVRPTTTLRPVEKVQNKTTTTTTTTSTTTTTTTTTVAPVETKTTTTQPEITTQQSPQTDTETPKTKVKPVVEDIINGTKVGILEGAFQPSNITAILNLNEPEVVKSETTSVSTGTTTKAPDTSTERGVHSGTEKYEIEMELPVLLEPSIGVGEAHPVLESSIVELSLLPTEQTRTATTVMNTQRPGQSTPETIHQYKARPGIVLDDPEYKPGTHKRPIINTRPIITAPPPHSHYGEIFDITVHAVQGPDEPSTGKPFVVPVDIENVQVHNSQVIKGDVPVITKPEDGQNFVSIDGKRTYINLFGEPSPTKINPTSTQSTITGTGYAIPQKESPIHQPPPPPILQNRPPVSTSPPRRPYKRPSHPPVRIDTCIVGDDTTCDSAQNEMCRTEDGVSSCHCRPGYNRRKHRDTCRRVVSMLTSLRVDRLYDRKVKWQDTLRDPDSEEYQQLSYEASQAIESAMSMTPFSDDFINSRINSIYVAKNLENNEPAVYVNVTIQLEENVDTVRPAVKHDIQRHLLRVIQRRNNNVGNSAVWVDAPSGSILALQDVDECSSSELHDCHERAICQNTFGSFRCQCPAGLRDPWVGNIHREGRFCEQCPSDFCNNRGECAFEHGQQVCHCAGSFYGTQCEIDGEVLGVAIGASVAAAIIIILTLVCLCMWSRRWSREQKSAVGAGMGSPVFGYMATGPTVKTPNVGAPPYQVSIEDRIRWAQIADVMAKSNHYAQPEPVNGNTRTSYGGYPTLANHSISMAGTLPMPTMTPPVPLPRLTLSKPPMGTYGAHSQLGSIHQSNHGIRSSLETTSSSEEEDRADLLGRNFNVPRPKSRTSVANQSGIYYDVDFDRSDAYSKQNTIPMNTYTLNPQHQIRPYFR